MAERDPKTGRFPSRKHAPKGGAGWGGAAKGASTTRIEPGDPAGITALRWDANSLEHKEQVAAQMRGVLYQVAMAGDAETARIQAADRLLDRIEGKPVQRQDVTSKGERLGYVISAPAEVEDAAEWAKQHKPSE